MTYKLYSHDRSGGFAVEAALVKAAAPFELSVVDTNKGEQNAADFVALNPMRQVPALLLPDGTLMTESAAMLIHLAAAFPGQGLAPPPATGSHARFLRWLVFMAVNVYEGDLRYFYSDRYTSDPAGSEGVKTAAAAHMRRSFAVLEQALSPFVAGPDLSVADAYLAMLVQWSPEPVTSPAIAAVVRAVVADPHYGTVWHRHGFAV